MDGIRCKVTPTTEPDGTFRLLMEWVRVETGGVGEVLASEEFRVAVGRQGCAYVSRAVFRDGQFLPGTFWLDEEGRRHFIMQAEAGTIGLTGKSI